jgi:hypothetical protein
MQVFPVGTEPGSGGCLDALNPRETRGARVAPTPSPPVEERPKSRGGSLRMCLGQDRRGAAPQTPLHKGWFVCSGARFSSRRYANALAPQWESICGLSFIFWDGSKTKPGVINRISLSRTHVKLNDYQLSTINYQLSTINYQLSTIN